MSYGLHPAYLGSVPSVYNPYAMTPWMGYPVESYSQPTASIPGSGYGYYAPHSGYHQYSWPQSPQSQYWPQVLSYTSVNPTLAPGQPESVTRTLSSQPAYLDSTNDLGSQTPITPIAISSPIESSSPSTPHIPPSSPTSTAAISAALERPSAADPTPIEQRLIPCLPVPTTQSTAIQTASSPPSTRVDAETIASQAAPKVAAPPVSVASTPPIPNLDRPVENASETPPSTLSTALSDAALRDLLQRLIKQRRNDESYESFTSPSAQGENAYTHDAGSAATAIPFQLPTPYTASTEYTPAIQSTFETMPRGRKAQLTSQEPRRNPSNQDDERFYDEDYISRQRERNYAHVTDMGWSPDPYCRSYLNLMEDEWDGEASRSDDHSSTNIASELGSMVRDTAKLFARGVSWLGSDILRPTIKGVSSVMSGVSSVMSNALQSFEEYAAEAELPPAPQLPKGNIRKLNKKGVKRKGPFPRAQALTRTRSDGSRESIGSALSSVFSRRQGGQGDESSVTSWESGSKAKLTRKQKRALKKQMKAAERSDS